MRMVRNSLFMGVAAAITAASAMAGFTTSVQNGINSNGPRGVGAGSVGPGNGSFVFNYAGTEFALGSIRIIGDLTEVDTGTWASEARFEVCNPSTCVVTGALTSTSNFIGTLHIDSTFAVPAGLTGTSIGNWTFEAFESFNDPGNPDAQWNNLTIQLIDGLPPVPVFSGNFTGTPNTIMSGASVSGTTMNLDPQQPGLTDGAGELAFGTRYGSSMFDQVGNEVGYRINHPGGNLVLDLIGMSTDLDLILLNLTGIPSTGTLLRSENGGLTSEHVQLLGAPAGVYFAVVETFGTSNAGSGFSLIYACACPGDMNGDAIRNGLDIGQFVQCAVAGGTCGCANVAGFVADLLAGATCP